LAPAPSRMRALRSGMGEGAAPALEIAAGFAFVTMCVGAYVSSSYAGLACSTIPVCDGSLFGHGSAQLAQMSHRLAAFAFTLVALIATFVASRNASRRVFGFALAGLALIAVQIFLGLANVVWQLPIALREAHAANAGVTFLAFVIAAVLAALDPQPVAARDSEPALEHGRSAGRVLEA